MEPFDHWNIGTFQHVTAWPFYHFNMKESREGERIQEEKREEGDGDGEQYALDQLYSRRWTRLSLLFNLSPGKSGLNWPLFPLEFAFLPSSVNCK